MKAFLIIFTIMLSVGLFANVKASEELVTFNNCPFLPVNDTDLTMRGIDLNIRWYEGGKPAGGWWTTGYAEQKNVLSTSGTVVAKNYIFSLSKPHMNIFYSDQGYAGSITKDQDILKCEIKNNVKMMTGYSEDKTQFLSITEMPKQCVLVEAFDVAKNEKMIHWDLCP